MYVLKAIPVSLKELYNFTVLGSAPATRLLLRLIVTLRSGKSLVDISIDYLNFLTDLKTVESQSSCKIKGIFMTSHPMMQVWRLTNHIRKFDCFIYKRKQSLSRGLHYWNAAKHRLSWIIVSFCNLDQEMTRRNKAKGFMYQGSQNTNRK